MPRKPRKPRAPRASADRPKKVAQADLNKSEILFDDEVTREPLEDYGVSAGGTEVVFRKILPKILELIQEADFVFGCVAWLTHPDILDALAKKSVCIIVQKEDFLRPDLGSGDAWRSWLRTKYKAIRCKTPRSDFDAALGSMNSGRDLEIEGVRCIGGYNRNHHPAFPRSHHKFVVLGKFVELDPDVPRRPEFCMNQKGQWGILTAAWTGSFNFTKNGCASLENAVVLRQPEIARAFFNEFQQVAALSEPLDWESDWMAPEWRIGS